MDEDSHLVLVIASIQAVLVGDLRDGSIEPIMGLAYRKWIQEEEP